MRAPQYGLGKGKKRVSDTLRAIVMAQVDGAVTVTSPNKPVVMKLWHKSAKALGYGPKKPVPVMTRAVVAEPPRQLAAIPPRDRYKSRNDRYRNYTLPCAQRNGFVQVETGTFGLK